ncbi:MULTISPECIES: hypothetical protein [Streptomyces]|uniref:hypothetical protein n=1 Tax=Streptomyces TaxID=1883 RepID=UPI00343D92F8
MRIGVYLAHPCPGSFNHAVADVRRIVFRTVTDSADDLRASWLRQARQQAAALMV